MSRKGRTRYLRRPIVLATAFMAQLLRAKNNKKFAKKMRRNAREKGLVMRRF